MAYAGEALGTASDHVSILRDSGRSRTRPARKVRPQCLAHSDRAGLSAAAESILMRYRDCSYVPSPLLADWFAISWTGDGHRRGKHPHRMDQPSENARIGLAES